MTFPDLINGAFESSGAFFISTSIVRLHKEKLVRGLHWLQVTFFMSWGYWNLFYYPHLHQWLSFTGGLAIVIANTIWLGQVIYYIRTEHKGKET